MITRTYIINLNEQICKSLKSKNVSMFTSFIIILIQYFFFKPLYMNIKHMVEKNFKMENQCKSLLFEAK